LPREKALADGSFVSTIYPTSQHRKRKAGGIAVRVVEYHLHGVAGAEPLYRLITTVLDPQAAPAMDLAALYHERWEIEGALDELKTHLRGAQVVLRSKTPALVRQEVWGLLLAHFAVRGLMHEAALQADEDPDQLSFLHAVRVIRRKLPYFAALPPSGPVHVTRRGARRNPGTAGGKQPRPADPARGQAQDEQLSSAPPLATPDHPYRLQSSYPGA
jgi:hypothetical protein